MTYMLDIDFVAPTDIDLGTCFKRHGAERVESLELRDPAMSLHLIRVPHENVVPLWNA